MAIFYKKHTNISPAWRAGEYAQYVARSYILAEVDDM